MLKTINQKTYRFYDVGTLTIMEKIDQNNIKISVEKEGGIINDV